MDIKQFEDFYENINQKEIEKNGGNTDNFTFVEYESGEHSVDFLAEFTQVFNNYTLGDILVDENIGFITDMECFYINRAFLEFCVENKIYNAEAYWFYYFNIDSHIDNESYSDCYERFKNRNS